MSTLFVLTVITPAHFSHPMLELPNVLLPLAFSSSACNSVIHLSGNFKQVVDVFSRNERHSTQYSLFVFFVSSVFLCTILSTLMPTKLPRLPLKGNFLGKKCLKTFPVSITADPRQSLLRRIGTGSAPSRKKFSSEEELLRASERLLFVLPCNFHFLG